MSITDLLGPLTRPLIFFDIEGTGPNPETDRIVELGLLIFKPDGSYKEWNSYINPGIPIPHEATYGKPGAVEGEDYTGHGITDAMVQGCRHCGALPTDPHTQDHDFQPWPTFYELSKNLLKGFTDCDFGGFNIRGYDLPIMAAEFKRAGIKDWSWDNAKIICGYRIWQVLYPRNLEHAVKYFLKRNHSGAHKAVDDIKETLEVVMAQVANYDLPRSVDALHEKCFPKDPDAIDPWGKLLWGPDGHPIINFGKAWKGMRLDQMKKRDLAWIADKADGVSPTVKAIAKDAYFGKYPTRPVHVAEPVSGSGVVPGSDGPGGPVVVPAERAGDNGKLFS